MDHHMARPCVLLGDNPEGGSQGTPGSRDGEARTSTWRESATPAATAPGLLTTDMVRRSEEAGPQRWASLGQNRLMDERWRGGE